MSWKVPKMEHGSAPFDVLASSPGRRSATLRQILQGRVCVDGELEHTQYIYMALSAIKSALPGSCHPCRQASS